MARIKRAVNARKNHKKVLKLAKGYYGGKSKLFKTANESVIRALRNAYIGRKLKKRDFRSLWIARINAAARLSDLSYSRFMNGMKLAGIDINRKMLSEIAIHDPKAFADLVEVAKNNYKLRNYLIIDVAFRLHFFYKILTCNILEILSVK